MVTNRDAKTQLLAELKQTSLNNVCVDSELERPIGRCVEIANVIHRRRFPGLIGHILQSLDDVVIHYQWLWHIGFCAVATGVQKLCEV